MKTIYKYELTLDRECHIQMPCHSQILSIQNQNNKIMLWALVDTENENEARVFEIYGTGHPMDDYYEQDRIHHATIQIGIFVWHIFERFEN